VLFNNNYIPGIRIRLIVDDSIQKLFREIMIVHAVRNGIILNNLKRSKYISDNMETILEAIDE